MPRSLSYQIPFMEQPSLRTRSMPLYQRPDIMLELNAPVRKGHHHVIPTDMGKSGPTPQKQENEGKEFRVNT